MIVFAIRVKITGPDLGVLLLQLMNFVWLLGNEKIDRIYEQGLF